eukprot:TRINITY_DN32463_c0_g1_i1.p1 TRINITY_DN32463_c0_g1~~TRINITY_DN32463_c0_g1_i1.p1  ORF type:complete len:849 (+),score=207.51 TRINITY_DN32463_c0_g1_i1:195-2549(+)
MGASEDKPGRRRSPLNTGWIAGPKETSRWDSPSAVLTPHMVPMATEDGVVDTVVTGADADLVPVGSADPMPHTGSKYGEQDRTYFDLDAPRWFPDEDLRISHPPVPAHVEHFAEQPDDVQQVLDGVALVPETWEDLGVAEGLCEVARKWIGEKPTTIQKDVLPGLLGVSDRDVVFSSVTGSGKTAAYVLAALNFAAKEKRGVTLIMVPSQQLALQVYAWALKWSEKGKLVGRDDVEWLQLHLNDPNEDESEMHDGYSRAKSTWNGGARIIIAQPGRWADYLLKWKLTLEVRRIIIDEALTCFNPPTADTLPADILLRTAFPNPADVVMSYYLAYPAWKRHQKAQVVLLTATFTEALERHVVRYLSPSRWVQLRTRRQMPRQLTHRFVLCDDGSAVGAFLETAERENPDRAVVFVDQGTDLQSVAEMMEAHGLDVRVYDDVGASRPPFQDYSWKYLLLREASAYGLDLKGVTHVFILHCPSSKEAYCHMSGRAGRLGASGSVVSVVERGLLPRWHAHMYLLDMPLEGRTSNADGEAVDLKLLLQADRQKEQLAIAADMSEPLQQFKRKLENRVSRRRRILYTLARGGGETLRAEPPVQAIKDQLTPRVLAPEEVEQHREQVRADFIAKAGSLTSFDQREALFMRNAEEWVNPIANRFISEVLLKYRTNGQKTLQYRRLCRRNMHSGNPTKLHVRKWAERLLLNNLPVDEPLLPTDPEDPRPGVPPVSRVVGKTPGVWADASTMPQYPGQQRFHPLPAFHDGYRKAEPREETRALPSPDHAGAVAA